MYRIPVITEGARGGSRETAAGPTAGARPGRFGERRVWIASQTPRALPGQGHATGSGVRSVATRPPTGPRADWVPSVIVLESATGTPGVSSGAFAARDVRRRSETLPEPNPTKSYRSYWNTFACWCERRNVQHWPASPETVADHLKSRAGHCALGTLHIIRTAISSTHRRAELEDPCVGDVVAATLEELAAGRGMEGRRLKSIGASSLTAAELDRVREAALVPRRRGRGFERYEDAARRGRVDLALCSLVLEAGLGCDQAAALEWRDLAADANERPTITIRPGSAGANNVIEISNRAHEDLRTIAPKSAEAGNWIFGLDAEQICERIRAAARVAGLDRHIAGTRPPRGARGETAGRSDSAVRIHDSYWRAFREWCDRKGKDSLPARAETVAEYLREGSRARKLSTIEGRRYVIREQHRRAGCDDPFATPLVEATMQGIRKLSRGFKPKSLNPVALAAIRTTAMTPRQTGRGRESGAVARNRGLRDIALCSVVYAARLSVRQAVALKWREVEIPGEDRARLTVKPGTDLHGSAEIREIAGQAVRDLEAIRGDAGPEDKVFGFNTTMGYKHINDAARAAGLMEPDEPSTAHPHPHESL